LHACNEARSLPAKRLLYCMKSWKFAIVFSEWITTKIRKITSNAILFIDDTSMCFDVFAHKLSSNSEHDINQAKFATRYRRSLTIRRPIEMSETFLSPWCTLFSFL
jgi:hypothetical protein